MVARGALLVAFGTVLGLLGVWYIGRFNAGFLFGVSSTDARSMAVATLVLLATGLVAAWLPARRAAFVDPVVALRTE